MIYHLIEKLILFCMLCLVAYGLVTYAKPRISTVLESRLESAVNVK